MMVVIYKFISIMFCNVYNRLNRRIIMSYFIEDAFIDSKYFYEALNFI